MTDPRTNLLTNLWDKWHIGNKMDEQELMIWDTPLEDIFNLKKDGYRFQKNLR